MTKRIVWVDYAKALSIFLVVLGHTHLSNEYRSIIYAFHIPLFFFLSGLFFSFKKFQHFKEFLKKRVSQLLVPYFVINIITYLIWLFVGRFTGADNTFNINPLEPFWGIIYGNLNGYFLHHNVPMWFLACLFMVEIVFWFLFRNLKKIQVIPVFVLLFIIGFIEYTYNKTPLPWGINIIPVPLIFYAAGYYGKKLIDFRISNLHSLFIIIISGALLIFISSINGKIEVSDTYYGNYFYFWPGAVAGIIFMITICKLLGNLSENITLMKFIGKNTLLIFAFHLTAGSALKAFSFYILKQPISIYEKNMIVLVYSILSILILLPFVQFINKKIPWIAGRAKNEI